MRNTMKAYFAIPLTFLVGQTVVHGQTVLFSWDFDGFSGSGAASSATYATVNDPRLTVGNFNRVGLIVDNQANTFAASGWDIAENTGKYFSFSVAVDTGKTTSFDSFDVFMTRKKQGKDKGPEKYNLYSVINGSSTLVASYQFSNNGASTLSQNVGLSGASVLQGLSGTVEFRITGFEDDAWTGFGANPSGFDLSFNGEVIPEPSTYAIILGLSALGWLAWKRRGSG
jgi:hypothetical protein